MDPLDLNKFKIGATPAVAAPAAAAPGSPSAPAPLDLNKFKTAAPAAEASPAAPAPEDLHQSLLQKYLWGPATKAMDFASNIVKPLGNFIGEATGIAGEAGAAAIDPNVRKQMTTLPADQFKETFPFLGKYVDQTPATAATKIAGSAAGAALNAAALPLGAEEAGAAAAAKSVKPSLLKIIGSSAKAGTLFGAGQGAASAAEDAQGNKQGLSDIVKQGAIGGAEGLAAGTVLGLAGAGALLSYGAYKTISSRINPTAVDALVNGVAATGKKASMFRGVAETVMPDLLHTANQLGIDMAASEKPIDDALTVADQAKKNVWKQYANLTGNYGTATIDGDKIAKAMTDSMDERFIRQNPAAAAAIEKKAATYAGPISVDQAEKDLQSANAELNSFYAKNKVGQSVALKDPETAHVVREAEALREGLYAKLDELTGQDAASLKKRYGALTEFQNQLSARKAVIDRAKPISLGEQIHYPMAIAKGVASVARGDVAGAAESLAQVGAAKAIREAQSNENMIRKAFTAAAKEGMEPYAYVGAPKPMTTNLLPERTSTRSAGGTPEVIPLNAPGLTDAETKRINELDALKKAGVKVDAAQYPDAVITKGKGRVYILKRPGARAHRISVQEALILHQAGYKLNPDFAATEAKPGVGEKIRDFISSNKE